jgi:hypothetical protein
MSTSPSLGHVKGSRGRSQKAGQMPDAHGGDIVATRLPRSRARVVWLVRRALVNCPFDAMALRTRLPWSSWNEFAGLST